MATAAELFTRAWTKWTDDFQIFHKECKRDMDNGIKIGGFSVPNAITTWCKVVNENNKQLVPMSMQIQHSVADGFHTARFFDEIEQNAKELAQTIDIS